VNPRAKEQHATLLGDRARDPVDRLVNREFHPAVPD
jgi:hypothetical protein